MAKFMQNISGHSMGRNVTHKLIANNTTCPAFDLTAATSKKNQPKRPDKPKEKTGFRQVKHLEIGQIRHRILHQHPLLCQKFYADYDDTGAEIGYHQPFEFFIKKLPPPQIPDCRCVHISTGKHEQRHMKRVDEQIDCMIPFGGRYPDCNDR